MATNIEKNVVRLSKNDVVNLTKRDPGMTDIIVGLGWTEVSKAHNEQPKGFFQRLFGTGGSTEKGTDIDCDAFAVLTENGKMKSEADVVYFGNLHHKSGAVNHTGDNLVGGDGAKDDEQIIIKTDKIPGNIDCIILAVNIYRGQARGQHFGSISNAFIRLVNAKTNEEVCRYDLTNGNYSGYVTVTFGRLDKQSDGSWQFKAIGEGDKASSISEFANKLR